MADYDKYYKTEDLFGNPYPELIDFFKKIKFKGTLLDLGCGQGRNAIPLARLAFSVTGVDSSKVGVNQMLETSNSENLNIKGLVQNIYEFQNFNDYDFILLDSMFHFDKRDVKKETVLIKNIVNSIGSNALICICIQDTGNKVQILKETISNTQINFEIVNDTSLIYKFEDKESGHKSETKYCMYIVRKIE